jgi:hypothetical protein
MVASGHLSTLYDSLILITLPGIPVRNGSHHVRMSLKLVRLVFVLGLVHLVDGSTLGMSVVL